MAAATALSPVSAVADTPKLIRKASTTNLKTPNSSAQTSFGCQHVKALLQSARPQAIDGYTKALQTIRKSRNVCEGIHKTGAGSSVTGRTTYWCLQCPNISTSGERHRKEHSFAIESKNGFLLCHDCKDFVYDPAMEALRLSSLPSKKRKLSDAGDEPIDRRTVLSNSTITSCAATGLRGLYNMGQTCFMSVILQSLIHNPFMRSFYLNEGHKSSECEREACTSCALDDIFTDFYGQEKHEGYGAVHMLQGCWKGGGGLAGYSQQDAHEYLGFILNSLHTANTEDEDDDEETQSTARDAKRCDCIVHQTFGGVYKSTVTCSACKNTTNTFDAFTDLSLDIRAPAISTKKKKALQANGIKDSSTMDLNECLTRFTSAETLSSDNYTCRKCDKAAEAEKRIRLHKLPPVLPIHLKRFSHSKTSAQSTKIDTRVRFPFSVNIAPFTTMLASLKSASSKESSHKDDEKDEAEHKQEPVYTLTSVIVHKGKIDNGHYISYSRQADEWFRFDDSMVVKVDEKEVLAAEAYMLFYTIAKLEDI